MFDRRRLLGPGVAILVAMGSFAAPASGELRTSHYRNPDMTNTGSATNPQVASMVLRYDTTGGTLSIRLVFFHSLADPNSTSALRQAFAEVDLGDAYGGEQGLPGCDRARDGLVIQAALGNNDPPTVGFGLFDTTNISASKSFTPSRNELDIEVHGPRVARLNLVCAVISAFNSAQHDAQFFSGPFLLDGFTVFDGNTTWLAEADLEDQARFVNNDLGRARQLLFFSGHVYRCRQIFLSTFRCRGKRRMPSVIGKPILGIAGTQQFQLRHLFGQDELFWTHSERASLSWRKCPAALHPPKRLLGRGCHITVRWRGGADLWRLFTAPRRRHSILERLPVRPFPTASS